MDIWGLMFLICLFFALKGMFRGVRNGYRNKVQKWDEENPNGNRWHRRGAMWAYLFSMLKDGPGYAIGGWKEGWAEGRAKGDEKWGQREPDGEASQEKVDANNPEPAPPPGPQPKPQLKLVKPPAGGQDPGGSMATEVISAETLYTWAEEKEKQAAMDLEDAKLAKQRVEEDLASTNQAATWMSGQKFNKADKGLVKPNLSEAEKAQLAACDALIAACQKKADTATAIKTMAAKHKQIQEQGGAGGAYGNS